MNNSYPKAFLLSIALTGIFFSLIIFSVNALVPLLINGQALTNPRITGLPITAVLLQFAIPAIGLWIYRFLNNRFPNNDLDKFSLSLSNLILGICVAILFFGYLKCYTLITFLISFALILYIEYKNKLRFMYRFYRTYIALLIPFYLLCVWIKNQGQLVFDRNATLKLDLIYMPIEVYFYFMGILLMTIYLFELFKSKELNTRG